MYEYNWVYTVAQIELMSIDAPLTCYKERKKDNPGRKPTAKEMDETVRKWKERKAKRKWKIADLMKGKNEGNEQGGLMEDKGNEQ